MPLTKSLRRNVYLLNDFERLHYAPNHFGVHAMGSTWFTGGVVAASRERIQFDFMFEGIRYRPSIRRPPSEANLRRARERLEEIKRQIEVGTFSFEEEFPDYRFLRRVNGAARIRSYNEVFDEFLAHCQARLARGDMAAATLSSYRRVLNGVWRPALGKHLFDSHRPATTGLA